MLKRALDPSFPEIETWPNQFPGYEIVVDDPEFTSVCPKTGLPDFGTVTIRYMPDKHCLELKSLKEYLQCYRNLGIFQENIVNRVLEDVVRWAKPVWAEVKGDFRPRGGISTVVVASGRVQKRTRRGRCPDLPGGAKLRGLTYPTRTSTDFRGSIRSSSAPRSAFTRLTS